MISILLVDGQAEYLNVVKKTLEKDGVVEVTASGSAEEAIELLHHKTYAIVISDFDLPGMDGGAFLKCLKACGNNVPAIIYSGKLREKTARDAMRCGAELFLQKSADPKLLALELRYTIEEVVRRKEAEASLKRREKDFHTIVKKNADAMLVLNKDGAIVYSNPAALDLFNLPDSELCEKTLGFPIILDEPVEMYIVRGYQEFIAAEMRMVEAEWGEKPSYLISFRDVTGHVQYEKELEKRVHERTSELEKINNQLLAEIESRNSAEEELRVEIEERNTAEEELRIEMDQKEEIEKALIDMKSQADLYLDLMGHDINNLNQIGIGYLELALESNDPDEIKSLIEKPLEVMRNASEIIDNVRKIKQVSEDRNTRDMANKIINVCDVLPRVKEQYSHLNGREVTININTPKLCFVRANDLIKDVFSNLVGNSIKHSDPARPLTIDMRINRVKEKGREYFICSVEDNGPGIPDWVKDKIFKRFQRGVTRAHGKGLGLFLIKNLVDSFHGAVWVEDRVPGEPTKGARFIVMLPAAE